MRTILKALVLVAVLVLAATGRNGRRGIRHSAEADFRRPASTGGARQRPDVARRAHPLPAAIFRGDAAFDPRQAIFHQELFVADRRQSARRGAGAGPGQRVRELARTHDRRGFPQCLDCSAGDGLDERYQIITINNGPSSKLRLVALARMGVRPIGCIIHNNNLAYTAWRAL